LQTEALEDWRTIVSLYSTGELSYSHDKLVALSGLAREIKKSIGSQYLVGLWRSFLEYQLLWAFEDQMNVGLPEPQNKTPYARLLETEELTREHWQDLNEIYRAPSWSWASVDGHVITASKLRSGLDEEVLDDEVLIDVSDVCVTPKFPDIEMGEIVGGYLRVRGSLVNVLFSNGYKGVVGEQLLEGLFLEDHRWRKRPLDR
jgi:hypothetical protein